MRVARPGHHLATRARPGVESAITRRRGVHDSLQVRQDSFVNVGTDHDTENQERRHLVSFEISNRTNTLTQQLASTWFNA